MNDHIADQDLAAYVDGALRGAPRAELESHLSRCPECLAALAEIVDIQDSAAKTPADFLRQALGEKLRPAKTVPPMRLVFGIAAVFLVVVLIGYFFLDRGPRETAGIAEKEMTRPAASAEDQRSPAADAVAEKARTGTATSTPAAGKPRARVVSGAQREKKSLTGEAGLARPAALPAGKISAPAALSEKTERLQRTDEKDMALRREAEGGAVGGILGGIEAQPDMDKENKAKLADADVAPGARAEELGKKGWGIPRPAAASVRPQGGAPQAGMPPRSRFPGSGASAGAMQIFLAVTGHAAAPPAVEIVDLAKRPAIRIAGDVARGDLSDPGSLDSWSWFPAGLTLELDIDVAGTVVAATPVGPWEEKAAARAEIAARKLLFAASEKKMRRAVLSVPAPPN